MPDYIPLCSIKHCHYLAESLKKYGLELCFKHQSIIAEWLGEDE